MILMFFSQVLDCAGQPELLTSNVQYKPKYLSCLQCSTKVEEEKLGVDFSDIWKNRQQAAVLSMVEPYMQPAANAKELHFPYRYAQSYVTPFADHDSCHLVASLPRLCLYLGGSNAQ
jgi:hypothetical protein